MMPEIKVCLYLEYYHFLKGKLFKNIGTGMLSSYNNQKKLLEYLRIPYVEKWDDSCDILQINNGWLKSIYLMKKAKRLGKKSIIWAHVTVEDTIGVFRFNQLIAPLTKKYLTYLYGLANLVFCPSEYTKGLLINYGLPEQKLIVQSNAVDLRKFYQDEKKRQAARTKYNLNTLTVGTVALAIPRKGIDTFLSLAEKFSQNQFIWFGTIYKTKMVKPLPKIMPQNVKFTDYVQDIAEAFNSLDIFMFLSTQENQGMVVLEAAAMGLPILVRDLPTYNDWLIHGENCLKAKNDQEVADYLKLLVADENLRLKLSANAKLLAQKESIEVLGEKLKLEYEKLLSKKLPEKSLS